jgi:hypothetical protein
MKLKYTIPLIGVVVLALVIGDGLVIPNSVIAGVNELSVGFGTTVLGACLAYFAGIHLVMKDPPSASRARAGAVRARESSQ